MAEEKIRVLICHTDGAVMELPWYEGDPQRDDTLNYKISQHRFPDGSAHFGNLFVYNAKDWAKSTYREAIINEIAKQVRPGSGDGLGDSFYDLKSNFQQDAIMCWKSFNKPSDPSYCDYRRENKRLVPDTAKERRSEGMDPGERPSTFLCDFCPVQSLVMGKQNKAKYG